MSRFYFLFLGIFSFVNSFSQNYHRKAIAMESRDYMIHGTLMNPDISQKIPIVLIIAGSGPTDRDGNNPQMKNNALKYLAEGLYENDIASLRYDKFMVGMSSDTSFTESELSFEHFVQDAANWIDYLYRSNQFSKIYVLGHSQGSLVGMLASQKSPPDGFISANGPGRTLDKVFEKQLEKQVSVIPELKKSFEAIVQSLRSGKTMEDVHPFLMQIFRPSVQPFLISWMKYDPAQEITKLDLPILIIQGNTDIQVNESDAQLLKRSAPKSQLVLIDQMNHIFKESKTDQMSNLATYYQPDLPIMTNFLDSIIQTIKSSKLA